MRLLKDLPASSPCCHPGLLEALRVGQRRALMQGSQQIVSYATEGSGIPLLPVLHHWRSQYAAKMDGDQTYSAYFAHAGHDEMVVLGSLLQCVSSDDRRFGASRTFMAQSAQHMIRAGDPLVPGSVPRWMAHFTFSPWSVGPFPAGCVSLPRWQLVQQGQRVGVVANIAVNAGSQVEGLAAEVEQQLALWRQLDPCLEMSDIAGDPEVMGDPWRFEQGIRQVRGAIESGQVQKVVLARAVDVLAAGDLSVVPLLDRLRRRYPNCYIFGVGQEPTFMGASPERLLRVERGEVWIDALAGSAPRGRDPRHDHHLAQGLRHSPKDRHEHDLVVQSICESLAVVGLRPHIEHPLGIRQLSNIQHLHTSIRTRLTGSLHLLDLLEKLHPTAAVSGTPRLKACQLLAQLEDFDRSLYAGPIGWLDLDGNGEFAVGIRSALVQGSQARLYGGAGIVASSDPAMESEEVRLKLLAMLNVLTQDPRL